MNAHAIWAIYTFEMARTRRTLMQSIASPVLSTSLYFVVFGSAIGSHMAQIDGVSYAAFIVPGLIMLSILTQSISNASFGIYFPKFAGTIYELLSAPVSALETVIGYVGAAATKSIILGLLTLATARVFVDFQIAHPLWMLAFLVLTSVTFSLFGFIIGVWADGFEKLQIVPVMVVTDSGVPPLSATQTFSTLVFPAPQPTLTVSMPSGNFSLLITGSTGPDYTVLASTNLTDWMTVFVTNPPALPFLWEDTAGRNLDRRFYRIQLGP